ncbi:MAG: DUF4837 family protein [Rikenellaceae bacterium]
MKIFKQILAGLLIVVSFSACDALRSAASHKVNSQGSPYELVVICNQPEWETQLGDTLRTVLSGYIPYLNQEESYFDVLRVTNQSYTGIVARHRNILEVNIQPHISEPSISVRYDVKATPQIIMTLQAPDIESATEYVSAHRESLIKGFEIAERDRSITFAQQFGAENINKTIVEKFGVEMKIPTGYTVRQDSEDMLWISFEHAVASQGVIIYSYPAEFGIASLSEENLVDARNLFTSRIPGPSDGSYMTTFTEISQQYRPIRIEGRLWVEMRGWWDVMGDFMGGPYVSYSTIDEQTNKVFTVDCYVYSPKYGKRNYLHALESLVYNVKFDSDIDTKDNSESTPDAQTTTAE